MTYNSGFTLTRVDGGLGKTGQQAEGLAVMLGICADASAPSGVQAFSDAEDAFDMYTGGALPRAIQDYLIGSNEVLAMPLAIDSVGTRGATTTVDPNGLGGSFTFSGTPIDRYLFRVAIVSDGDDSTATWRYSLDNGLSWSATLSMPAGAYSLTDVKGVDTGVDIAFSGNYDDEMYAYMTSIAPTFSNADLTTALTFLENYYETQSFEAIFLIGPTTATQWALMDAGIESMQDAEKNVAFGACENAVIPSGVTTFLTKSATGKYNNATPTQLATFTTALQVSTASFAPDSNVIVCSGYGRLLDDRTGQHDWKNLLHVIGGVFMSKSVQTSPGKRQQDETGCKLPSVLLDILDFSNAQINTIDTARQMTVTRAIELLGFYVYLGGRTTKPLASDYTFTAETRVVAKASRLIIQYGEPLVEGDFRLDPDTGLMDVATQAAFEAILGQGLMLMKNDGEISGYEISVPGNQNFLASQVVKVNFSIVTVAYYRTIQGTIGLKNPFNGS